MSTSSQRFVGLWSPSTWNARLTPLWGACWKRSLLIAALTTVAVFVAAYGFGMANLTYNHDGIAVDSSTDLNSLMGPTIDMQVGRFAQPLLFWIRGGLNAPWLVGVLAILWLMISNMLLLSLLHIRSVVGIIVVCAALTATPTITLTFASFMPYVDIYAFALLFATLAAWLWSRGSIPQLIGAILCVFVSLCIYQAYISVFITLGFLTIIRMALERTRPRLILEQILKAAVVIVGGLAIYAGLYFIESRFFIENDTHTYNSLESVGDFSDVSITGLMADSWLEPLRWSFYPPTVHRRFVGVVNVIVLALTLGTLIWLIVRRHLRAGSIALIIIFLLLLPLGAGCVVILSKGLFHDIMAYSFSLYYAFVVAVAEQALIEYRAKERRFSLQMILAPLYGLIVLTVFCQVVYANDVLLEKKLIYDETMSFMTRVVERVETTEGYVPGETPVAFVDSDNAIAFGRVLPARRPGFDRIEGLALCYPTSMAYYYALDVYFDYILQSNMNVMSYAEMRDTIRDLPEVKAMETFPLAGSVKMIDGVVVVKVAPIS